MPRELSESEVAEFRRRLMDAAERCVAEEGFAGVSMRRLAARLGCSATTPYRYFRDKDHILASATVAALNRLSEALELAMAGAESAAAGAAVVREAYVQYAFENRNAYHLMFEQPHPRIRDYPELQEAAARAERTMTSPIERLIEAGLIDGDPFLLGRIYWSAIHGAVSLQLAGKLETGPSFEAVLTSAMRLISTGVRAEVASFPTARSLQ